MKQQALVTSSVTPSAERVVSRRELAAMLNVSLVTLWRAVQRGDLPAPQQITRGRRGWRLSVINAWLESRPSAPSSRSAA